MCGFIKLNLFVFCQAAPTAPLGVTMSANAQACVFLETKKKRNKPNHADVLPCLIAFGKPAGHREVAPREFDVHSRWKPAREQKRKEGGRRRRRKRRRIRIRRRRRRRTKENEDKAVKRKRLV
jgi:hypothetical protein